MNLLAFWGFPSGRKTQLGVEAMDPVSCGEERFGAIFRVELRGVAKTQRGLRP
ncbi:MAG TPA: hypothetical protein VLG08_05015 [Casimicrobiaceae bacterium]|nr:hypothetical protein [Casimicrobiaceae bacterium]